MPLSPDRLCHFQHPGVAGSSRPWGPADDVQPAPEGAGGRRHSRVDALLRGLPRRHVPVGADRV